MFGQETTGLAGPDPARVHQREERDGLPAPRRGRVELRRGAKERLDLALGEQVGVGGHGPGFPLVGQHVGVALSAGAKPPAEVTDVGHPRPVAARGRQLGRYPPLDGLLVEDAPGMLGAVRIESSQVPDPRGAVTSHGALELDVLVEAPALKSWLPQSRHLRGAALHHRPSSCTMKVVRQTG